MSTRTLEVLCVAGIVFILVSTATAVIQKFNKDAEPTYAQQCAALGGKVEERSHVGAKAITYTTRQCVVTK